MLEFRKTMLPAMVFAALALPATAGGNLAETIERLNAKSDSAKDVASAQAALTGVEKVFQGDFKPYFNLGLQYEKAYSGAKKAGDKDAMAENKKMAKAFYQEALKRDPLRGEVHQRLAAIAIDEQDGGAFIFHGREFLRLWPDHQDAAGYATTLGQLGVKDLKKTKHGWVTPAEEKVSIEYDLSFKGIPVDKPVDYLLSYKKTDYWNTFDGDVAITYKGVTFRGDRPVATFVLTQKYESDRFLGLVVNQSATVLLEPSGAIPVMVTRSMQFRKHDQSTLISHNVFLLTSETMDARTFASWDKAGKVSESHPSYFLPLKEYKTRLSMAEREAVFGGTGTLDETAAVKDILDGKGVMVPRGVQSEVSDFFTAFLLSRQLAKNYEFPVVVNYQYPHRSGENVSPWGIAYTSKATMSPGEVSAGGRSGGRSGGGVSMDAVAGGDSSARIEGEQVSEEYYSARYPFIFERVKLVRLEDTSRKSVAGKEIPVVHFGIAGFEVFVDHYGLPVEYQGPLYTIRMK